MKNTQRVISLHIALLLIPRAAVSQVPAQTDRAVFQRLTQKDKLSIELKNGKNVEGKYSASTDTTLTLSVGKRTQDVAFDDVKRVYRVTGKSKGKSTLKGTAVGAIAGAATGAA